MAQKRKMNMLANFLKKHFPDSVITKFWQDPRKRALVLLPLWIIFIVIIFIVYIIPYNNEMKNATNKENNTANETIVEDNEGNTDEIVNMWQELFDMDYEYKILVYKNEDIIEYEGIKALGEVTGTKSDINGESEYYIQDDIVYNVIYDNPTIYGTLSDIEYDIYLNPKLIYESLTSINPSKTDSGYIYENGEDYVIISTDGYINNIEIEMENTKYILSFAKID